MKATIEQATAMLDCSTAHKDAQAAFDAAIRGDPMAEDDYREASKRCSMFRDCRECLADAVCPIAD